MNNANKRACNKQETVDLVISEDHNDFLNNNITPQSKSTGAKRSYKKKQVTVEPLNKMTITMIIHKVNVKEVARMYPKW